MGASHCRGPFYKRSPIPSKFSWFMRGSWDCSLGTRCPIGQHQSAKMLLWPTTSGPNKKKQWHGKYIYIFIDTDIDIDIDIHIHIFLYIYILLLLLLSLLSLLLLYIYAEATPTPTYQSWIVATPSSHLTARSHLRRSRAVQWSWTRKSSNDCWAIFQQTINARLPQFEDNQMSISQVNANKRFNGWYSH